MSEEKEKQATPEDTGEGVQPKATTIVDDALTAAERLEKATEEAGNVAGRIENAVAKSVLGGKTQAGQLKPTPEQEKEAESKKQADEIVAAFT